MSKLEQSLREKAQQLLADGSVQLIIGYEQGTLPLRTTPCFIRSADQVDRLVWNAGCENNLATYLHRMDGRVGIVAKGCDARSIISEIVERQLSREDVVVIGIPCQGVLDRRKMENRMQGRELLEGHLTEEYVRLIGPGFEEKVAIVDMLCDDCLTCQHKNPPLHDILVGELSEETPDSDRYSEVRALETQTPEERWDYFREQFSRCIRCYACRQACPSCYCAECFIDQSQPSWFGKSDDLSDVMAFHLVRTYHVAGRCLDCGACARACPVHIDLRTLQKKLQKEVLELYGYEAGVDLEATPALPTFRPEDPQDFMK